MLVVTVTAFTVDLSYARSIGKREASAVISFPIQRHIRPASESRKTSISRQAIYTRQNTKSRRAESDDAPSEDSSEGEDTPEPWTNILGIKAPTRTPGYQAFESSRTDQGDTEDGGRETFSEAEAYSARLPWLGASMESNNNDLGFNTAPLSSTFIATTGPSLDTTTSTINPFIPNPLKFNLNPQVAVSSGIAGDSGVNPFAATSLPNGSAPGTKVSSLPVDESGNSGGANKQKEDNKSNKPNAVANAGTDADTVSLEETETTSDGNTKTEVTVKKINADGTPVVFNIYLNGEKGGEITDAVKDKPSGEEGPTENKEGNQAVAATETRPESSGDESVNKDEQKSKPGGNVRPVEVKDSSQEKSTSPETTQQPSEEPDMKLKEKKPENKTDPEEADPEGTGKEQSDKKTNKEQTDKAKQNSPEADKNKPVDKGPPPEEMKHGDYTAFLPTEAGKDETFATVPKETETETETGADKFGKTTLSAEVANLIAWKGDSSEKQARDLSTSTFTTTPRSSDQRPRRQTRTFRA